MPTLISFLLIVVLLFALPAVMFALYRYCLPLFARWQPPTGDIDAAGRFTVGLVTVSHVASSALAEKLTQFENLQTEFSTTRTPIVSLYAGLDGELKPTGADWSDFAVEWVASASAMGKNRKLSEIVARIQASSDAPDVLVFSDVDALVAPASLQALFAPFGQTGVGAVTGRRQIQDDSGFADGQKSYVSADDSIRAAEMRYLGSVTSSDGKLYAIRRELIDELPEDVTDDLFTALGAIASGQRLVSAPDAVAVIGRPARDRGHDLTRRRRVTTRGLSTLWRRRSIMNPWRTGGYGPALFVNKGLRRLAAPGLVLSCMALSMLMALLLLPGNPLVFAGLLALGLIVFMLTLRHAGIRYLLLGIIGMSLGVFDFIRGKRIARWEPQKQAVTSANDNRESV